MARQEVEARRLSDAEIAQIQERTDRTRAALPEAAQQSWRAKMASGASSGLDAWGEVLSETTDPTHRNNIRNHQAAVSAEKNTGR